jgi:DNA topoisomerase-1
LASRLLFSTGVIDPKESAAIAGLRYVNCNRPGFQRRKRGERFAYLDLQGRPIRDRDTLHRIRSLVLPPAWDRVWICPSANGHLQATGVDARGRRQYRYHPQYRQFRNETKFGRMLEFAKALPSIRERVEKDLGRKGLPREKVVATIVRLLETTFIRVGNDEYARENSSFGLTTLRDRHVEIEGSSLRFHFRGKSAQMHEVTVDDPRLIKIIRDCRDLPGYELFQYCDDFDELHSIDSSEVNGYLQHACGKDFTAKDFRTWAGTIQTALSLAETGPAQSSTAAKKNIVDAVKQTAARLGNKPITCRNYYVHPAILESYMKGAMAGIHLPAAAHDPHETGLHPEERAVMALIRKACAATEPEVVRRSACSSDRPARGSASDRKKAA